MTKENTLSYDDLQAMTTGGIKFDKDKTYFVEVITKEYPQILEYGMRYKKLGYDIPNYCTDKDLKIITKEEFEEWEKSKKEEDEPIDGNEVYYVEYIRDWDGWEIGDRAKAVGTYYVELIINNAIKNITKEEFETPRPKESEVAPSATSEEDVKEVLMEEMKEQEVENYKEGEINWLEGDFYDEWGKVKGHMKNIFNEGNYPDEIEWKFLAHSKDIIKGKPQLTEQIQKKIPLIRQAVVKKKEKVKGGEYEEVEEQHFFFFDDRFDKRYNGYLKDTFSLFFYIYQVITENEKKYFVLSQEKLPHEVCELSGMLVEMDDYTELSKNLKVPSISGFFILKEAKPDVKTISKEELVNFTKEIGIDEGMWFNILAIHPSGTKNNFPEEMEHLKSSFVLSGKVDGWPMHLSIMGPPGTKKTMGHIESLSSKFEMEPRIAEGSGWTIKGLGPSFRGTIADIGYFAKAHRMGWIDELGKLVEKEIYKHDTVASNLLGDFNFLLEHKNRLVGSGNTGEVRIQANAKFLIVTNPMSNKRTLAEHLGVLDPTYMSRSLWWVQDKDEQYLTLSKNAVERFPPRHPQAISKGNETNLPPHTSNSSDKVYMYIDIFDDILCLTMCRGECVIKVTTKDFLTIFDSCQVFCSEIDDTEIDNLVNITTELAKEPMKSSVWKPRAYHHIKLLIDGLCKQRCLFKDYDSKFEANREDYDMAERILIRMVLAWETDLSPKGGSYDTL